MYQISAIYFWYFVTLPIFFTTFLIFWYQTGIRLYFSWNFDTKLISANTFLSFFNILIPDQYQPKLFWLFQYFFWVLDREKIKKLCQSWNNLQKTVEIPNFNASFRPFSLFVLKKNEKLVFQYFTSIGPNFDPRQVLDR